MLQGPHWEKGPNLFLCKLQLYSTNKHLQCVAGLCWAWEPWSGCCWLFFEFLETGFGFFLSCFQELLWRLAGTLCEIAGMGISACTRCSRCGQRCSDVNRQYTAWFLLLTCWRYLGRRNFIQLKNFLHQMTCEYVWGTFSWLPVDMEGLSPTVGGIVPRQ